MKQLILIRGPICAGKSTVVRILRGRLKKASHVDFDALKQQIDDSESSPWRQELALKASLFLTEKLMKLGRTIIIDIPSSKQNQYQAYRKLAEKNGYSLIPFLLRPPLKTCLERNRLKMRDKYKIPDKKIKEYYRKTFPVPGELKFDTSKASSKMIASGILRSLPH